MRASVSVHWMSIDQDFFRNIATLFFDINPDR